MILQNSKGPGSHEYVINETLGIIRASVKDLEPILKNVELTNIQKLRKNIGDLKLFRVQSDYHNIEIDPTTSNKALDLSQNIISKINTFLA